MGFDVLLHLDVVVFILLINQGRLQEVKCSWRYFNTVKIQNIDVDVSDYPRYAHVR